MARTKFIAGNWKMNTTKAQAVALATAIARGVPSAHVQVGVAPPFVYLDAVGQAHRGGLHQHIVFAAAEVARNQLRRHAVRPHCAQRGFLTIRPFPLLAEPNRHNVAPYDVPGISGCRAAATPASLPASSAAARRAASRLNMPDSIARGSRANTR